MTDGMIQTSAGEVIAVVPAAGHGSRMGSKTPKQYLPLHGTSVLNCTLNRLFAVTAVKKIILVIGKDEHLPDDIKTNSNICITPGGMSRSESVRNGLAYMSNELQINGPVMVHDAARPCVRVSDISNLIAEVAGTDNGGLLAIPVHDTLKKSDEQQRITSTVDRNLVWRAVTPQLFQCELLIDALDHAASHSHTVTDEASAMELMGYQPRLIRSAQDNIKITEQADLLLAQSILEAQERK